jgi:hypothetical protein
VGTEYSRKQGRIERYEKDEGNEERGVTVEDTK